jgi:hypothetical protein
MAAAAVAASRSTKPTTDAGPEPPPLRVRIPVDELARYAGLTALASTVLAVAGILATATYLSAWGVPTPVVRMDPLTAALRSESVVYQFLTLALIVFGLSWLSRKLADRGLIRYVMLAAAFGVLGFLAAESIAGGYLGPTLTVVGGAGVFLAHERGLASTRTASVLFITIAFASAFQTGAESGRLIRDRPEFQTPVVLATRTEVAGLPGGVETGGGWQYERLYLVFRDGESIYVSRPGLGAATWIVPAGNLMSLGIKAP